MIVDTDVLVWYLRGNGEAKTVVEAHVPFSISVVTCMELLQGMKNKTETNLFCRHIRNWSIDIMQIDREISTRAMFSVQEYALSHSMMLADALIAATAVQTGEPLLTANEKNYRYIATMECQKFNPEL